MCVECHIGSRQDIKQSIGLDLVSQIFIIACVSHITQPTVAGLQVWEVTLSSISSSPLQRRIQLPPSE